MHQTCPQQICKLDLRVAKPSQVLSWWGLLTPPHSPKTHISLQYIHTLKHGGYLSFLWGNTLPFIFLPPNTFLLDPGLPQTIFFFLFWKQHLENKNFPSTLRKTSDIFLTNSITASSIRGFPSRINAFLPQS